MNPPTELAQWLGFTETSILLLDGLLRLTDLVEVPSAAIQQLDKDARVQQILRHHFNNLLSDFVKDKLIECLPLTVLVIEVTCQC